MIINSVCCIIITYNIGEKFYECYNAIKNQVEKVVVVDNGSNKETVSVLKKIELNKNTTVIYNNTNLGIATALNMGVKVALNEGFEWILTMDNDSIASNEMIKDMMNIYKKIPNNENVVSIFPEYVDLALKNNSFNNIESEKYEYKYINAEITSGNLVKTKVFKEIGFFEDKLFIDMVDFEFCFRIRKYGYELVKLSKPILFHNLGKITVKKILGKNIYATNHNYIRRYYISRNRFYIWNKYRECNYLEIKKEKKFFWKEIIKIIVLENDKLRKIGMIIKGYKDYLKGIYGKIDKD